MSLTADCIFIKEINLVHFSHTDVGFTDHPDVCRDLHRRFLDIAIDATLATSKAVTGERFCWTAETTLPVDDWWRSATPARRRQFLKALSAGQIDVAALAFNNSPFLGAGEWHTMLHWLPNEVWKLCRPYTAVQNDVNGLPRAAALAALDRGIRYLWMGINEDNGGIPLPCPSSFWWKMPDGRRLFVWLNLGYNGGYFFFENAEWRRGPVPLSADTTYRTPHSGDIFRTDAYSLRNAHRICLDRIRVLEGSGYQHPVLTISITNMWHYDNDPPFPPLADFVAAWNKQGLLPRLLLTTITSAMRQMEKVMGDKAPEYSGEWTDWWANGVVSAPREVAAIRIARRLVNAISSPLWGKASPNVNKTIHEINRDLTLCGEHTWGDNLSIAQPFNFNSIASFNEKSRLAWRPLARAEWLFSQCARTKLVNEGEGLFVINPTKGVFCGWVYINASCLRGDFKALEDPRSGSTIELYFEPGPEPFGRPMRPDYLTADNVSSTFSDNAPNRLVKFWIDRLEGDSFRHFRFSNYALKSVAATKKSGPRIETDKQGWPVSIIWSGMKKPLFLPGVCQFAAMEVKGFAPRWLLRDIRAEKDKVRHEQLRSEQLREVIADPEELTRVETPKTILITQTLRHARFQWAVRIIEIWKHTARARFTIRFNRLSSFAPEIFYLDFPLPTVDMLPLLSNGGVPFTPFTDQIPGTCRDYFAIDGWAHYDTPDGQWLWISRDAPLITFGANSTLALRNEPPVDVHQLRAILFDNTWYTNFVADQPGILEFQFDLLWNRKLSEPIENIFEAVSSKPLVLINPSTKEHPRLSQHLYKP